MVKSLFLFAAGALSASSLEGSTLLQVSRDAQLQNSRLADADTLEAQLELHSFVSASNAIRSMEADITVAAEAKASAFMNLYTTAEQARQALNMMKQAHEKVEVAREDQAKAVADSEAKAQQQFAFLTRHSSLELVDDDQEEAEDVGLELTEAQARLRERADGEELAFAEFAAATKAARAAQKVASTAAAVAAQADAAEESATILFACKSKEISAKAVLVQSGQTASTVSTSDTEKQCEDARADIQSRRVAIAVVQEEGGEALDEAQIVAKASDEAKAYTEAQAAAVVKVSDQAVQFAKWSALAVEAGKARKLATTAKARVLDADKAAKDAAAEARATEKAQMEALEGEGESMDDPDNLRKLIDEVEAKVAAKATEKADAFVELHAAVKNAQEMEKAAKEAQREAELAAESEEEAVLDAFQKGRAVRDRAELAWRGALGVAPNTAGLLQQQ